MVATMVPGPASSGVPERDQRDVDVLHLLRVVGAAGQQVERDQQQEQPAGALQRRDADAEVVQDLLAEDRERADHRRTRP